jgi:hypothetical protein
MLGAARMLLVAIGGLTFVGGLLALVEGREAALVSGLILLVVGGVLIAVPLNERLRYRANAVDRSNPVVGPGGGEPLGAIDPRFEPTDEVFVDPTSERRMRVLIDPRSGERRYRAED